MKTKFTSDDRKNRLQHMLPKAKETYNRIKKLKEKIGTLNFNIPKELQKLRNDEDKTKKKLVDTKAVVYRVKYSGTSFITPTDGYGYPRKECSPERRYFEGEKVIAISGSNRISKILSIMSDLTKKDWPHPETSIEIEEIEKIVEIDAIS